MIDRRHFLTALASATASSPLWLRFAGAPALSIIAADGVDADVRRGVEMSVDESQRSAAMFGGRITLVSTIPTDASLSVVIGNGNELGSSSDVIYMSIGGEAGACRPRVFDLAPPAGKLAWLPQLTRFGADTLNKRFRGKYDAPMTSAAWCGWFAVKCSWEAALRSNATSVADLMAYLRRDTTRFDGHKGVPLRFDASRRLLQPVYSIGADGSVVEHPALAPAQCE